MENSNTTVYRVIQIADFYYYFINNSSNDNPAKLTYVEMDLTYM